MFREGSLRQLTSDHSVTAALVRNGQLSEDDALVHPHRHVLTRALGAAPDVDAEAAVHTARAGDRLLVCSDGLFNEVPDAELETLMGADIDLQATADALVGVAIASGGRDNVSVVVAEVCL